MPKVKKVDWHLEYDVYDPFCPYCGELAYEKDYCAFCLKPYKWVEKSKDRKVTVGGYTIVQASNKHIHIYEGERMVLHASCTKRKSKRRLKKMVEYYEYINKGGIE